MKFDSKDMKLMSNMASVLMNNDSNDPDMPDLESMGGDGSDINKMVQEVMNGGGGEIGNMVNDVLGNEEMMNVVMGSVQNLISGINNVQSDGSGSIGTIQNITSQISENYSIGTKKHKPLKINVNVNEHEMYTGVEKKIRINRQRIDLSKKTDRNFFEKDNIKINVPKGVCEGDTIEIKGLGHEYEMKGVIKRTPIVARFQSKGQSYGTPMVRKGLDIHYEVGLTLKEILMGGSFVIHNLDRTKTSYTVDKGEVDFKEPMKIRGGGFSKDDGECGDMYIKLYMILPDESVLNNINKVLSHPDLEFDIDESENEEDNEENTEEEADIQEAQEVITSDEESS